MPIWLESSQLIFIAAGITAALSVVALWLRLESRATARNMLVVALVATSAQLLNAALTPMSNALAVDWVRDVVLVVLAAALLRMVGMVLFRGVLQRLGANPPRIVEDLTVTGVFLAWMVMWLRMSGVDFTSIVATSAVITAVIAFSMQETLGNILGGVALQLDHSIRIGDWVKVDDLSGRVVEIRWRYTAIETRNRETVVVPNSFLMKNRFTVIGSRNDKEPRWRRWVWFNVSTDAGVGRVIEVLERSVRDASIAHVAVEPAPSATLMEALPNGGRFALRYWLTDPQCDDPTDSAVRTHALAALTRAGISLVLPVEERMLIKENAEFYAARAEREQARRVGVLRNVDLFKTLSDSETESLAHHLVHAPFVKGDVMTRQGAVAHWLYLIVAGQCDVVVDKADGERKLVATLSDGSIFGEMGMMTGEPRRATVIAATDVECYRLDKEGFRAILEARPDLAQEISRVLVDRNVALVKTGGSDPGNRQHAQVGLINKIRAFFDLG